MHNHALDHDEAGHEYNHEHELKHRSKWPMKIVIVLTAIIFAAEIAGGLLSGSLALMSDALHMLEDISALLLSLAAMIIAERLPTPSRTFGYHRVEIGAALVNGIFLAAISIVIIAEALARFSSPRVIDSTLMGVVAIVGLGANLVAIRMLHGSTDLNVKGAFLHILGDTLSSVAVIVAAVWIAFTGQTIIDPLLSLLIAILILASSIPLLREAGRIFLQFAPRDVDTDAVIRTIESVESVDGVHNVHLWSLCSNINVLDAHIYSCETDARRLELIKETIKHRLVQYRIRHSTLEFECRECEDFRLVREMRD
jgi:cobalt-zinc-cadmium efflux system protein